MLIECNIFSVFKKPMSPSINSWLKMIRIIVELFNISWLIFPAWKCQGINIVPLGKGQGWEQLCVVISNSLSLCFWERSWLRFSWSWILSNALSGNYSYKYLTIYWGKWCWTAPLNVWQICLDIYRSLKTGHGRHNCSQKNEYNYFSSEYGQMDWGMIRPSYFNSHNMIVSCLPYGLTLDIIQHGHVD